MKREPSIHISESRMQELAKKYFGDWISGRTLEYQVIQLIIDAKKYQLSNRKLLASNKKDTQKANIISKSPLEDAMIMAKVIYMIRKEMKHKGIEIAKPGSRDFTIIKTITSNALEYKEALGITGANQLVFQKYIRTFLKLVGNNKFNLISLQGRVEQIIEFEEAQKAITSDTNKGYTDQVYESYCRLVIDKVGELLVDYKKVPKLYQCFVMVAKECRRLKVSPSVYIIAQFKGLEWRNSIPDPMQLVGPKALERLQKYLYENNLELGNNKEEKSKENIKSLKNLKKLK